VTRIRIGSAIMAALILAVLIPTASVAKAGDVIRTGTCDGSSTWKLKLSPEDPSLIQVAFEVDQNVIGQNWKTRIRHNGELALRTKRTTRDPSGSFTVRTTLPDLAGKDRVKGIAVNPLTGERCVARAVLRD
jgi:hypothetical protein